MLREVADLARQGSSTPRRLVCFFLFFFEADGGAGTDRERGKRPFFRMYHELFARFSSTYFFASSVTHHFAHHCAPPCYSLLVFFSLSTSLPLEDDAASNCALRLLSTLCRKRVLTCAHELARQEESGQIQRPGFSSSPL